MKTQRLTKISNATVIVAELSHIFCCGLPLLMAVLATSMQVGVSSSLLFLHYKLHAYEIPILIGSGLLLVVGLLLQYISHRLDCRSTGCHHEPCAPKKMKVSKLFIFAVAMYAVNIAIYVLTDHGAPVMRFN
jgi:hypothetical protein